MVNNKNSYLIFLFTLPLLLFTWIVFSCQSSINQIPELSQAESCMEERPDSALDLLQAVDTLQLTTEEQKAKYALLLSMALDKNIIDRTDFDVLQPAIDYYADHGTATDQLRTYYYQGRIYVNAGNNPNALKAFMKATDKVKDSDDILTKARLYFAQIDIYMALLKFDKAEEVCQIAAEYFKKAGRDNSYANCMTTMINICTLLNDESKTFEYISKSKELLEKMSPMLKENYYNNTLVALTAFKEKDEIETLITEINHNLSENELNKVAYAYALFKIGDYDQSLKVIKSVPIKEIPSREKVRCFALLAQNYELQHSYKEAYEAYYNYVQISDSVDIVLFREDAQFIADRHQLEMQTLKQEEAKNKILWMGISSICILIAIILWICLQLKNRTLQKNLAEQEKFKYQQMYSQMEEEHAQLKNLLEHQNKLDDTIKSTIVQRLNLLNDFFKTHIKDAIHCKDNLSKKINEILADQNAFIESTRLAFLSSHPQFIEHLEKQELTNWEIGYCCLYALGLNGKEVGTYMNLKNNYKINSDIRKKLKLDSHSTNLNCYILQIFEEYNKE